MKVQIIKFESHTYFDLFVVKNIRREGKRELGSSQSQKYWNEF